MSTSQEDRPTFNVCFLTSLSPKIFLSAKPFRPVKVHPFVVQHCFTLTLKNGSDQTIRLTLPGLRLTLFSMADFGIVIGQTGGKLINCCAEKKNVSSSIDSLCVVVFRNVNQTLSRTFCTAKP